MLEIDGLTVEFLTPTGIVRAVDDLSYAVAEGEVVGVVGESGSGKSVTVQAALGLLASPPARVVAGEVRYQGRNLLNAKPSEMRKIRGKEIGFISQDPLVALNPVMTIGDQIAEALRVHQSSLSRSQARAKAVSLLNVVQVPNAERRMKDYPHQFSGGMAQRVVIAMAIANEPRLLIADEPTTALDVTIQAQVLRTLKTAQETTGAAMILITHDLAVIAEFAQRVVVMYGGRVVESGNVLEIFERPQHPYTRALLDSVPNPDTPRRILNAIPGQPPEISRLPSGCAFHPRCFLGSDRERCRQERPMLRVSATGGLAACHYSEEMEQQAVAPSQNRAANGSQ